jgi:putative endonuclease
LSIATPQTCASPPSTNTSPPVMKLLSDEARNAATAPVSDGSAFCRRYGLDRLVYVEEFPTIEEAIAREKAMKAWKRAWKIELIEKANPEWVDYSVSML